VDQPEQKVNGQRTKSGQNLMNAEAQFVLKMFDMTDEMVSDLKSVIKEAFAVASTTEREIALAIKKHFDANHNPIWHCVVGKSFGAFGTHETKHFVYLYYGPTAIHLWKCG
jgi:dynein light chain LC8-type